MIRPEDIQLANLNNWMNTPTGIRLSGSVADYMKHVDITRRKIIK